MKQEGQIQANKKRWSNVRLMLAHRLRRWANINLALGQRLVFAGYVFLDTSLTLETVSCGW